jgi:hypothetical protein
MDAEGRTVISSRYDLTRGRGREHRAAGHFALNWRCPRPNATPTPGAQPPIAVREARARERKTHAPAAVMLEKLTRQAIAMHVVLAWRAQLKGASGRHGWFRGMRTSSNCKLQANLGCNHCGSLLMALLVDRLRSCWSEGNKAVASTQGPRVRTWFEVQL